MATTRRVHVVRIKGKQSAADGDGNSSQPWVDVKVLDAVSLLTANGDQLQFEVMQTATGNVDTSGTGYVDTSSPAGEERL
jgi:hypothetical protein